MYINNSFNNLKENKLKNIMREGNISKTSSVGTMHIVDKKQRNYKSHGKRNNRNQRIKYHMNNGRHHFYVNWVKQQ